MARWILSSIGAFLFWGFWSFIPKFITSYMNPRSALIFETLGGIIFSLFILISLKFRPEIHLKGIMLAILTGILGFAGTLCYLYAASKGPISMVALISALYPIVSIILGYFFLNETLTLRQEIGLFFGILSIILLLG